VRSRLARPIFVVGCPRSGTTLVQCILSASSRAFSLPETHFFSYVLPETGRAPGDRLSIADVQHARALLEAESDLPDLAPLWITLQQRLEQEQELSALDLFMAIVEFFRPAAGQRAIEKTPLHVLHLDQIGACFPDALFVNVVRDPVDVVSSLLGVPWQHSHSVVSLAQRWIQSVEAARAFATVHPGRLETVVYEELVGDPAAQVQRLCAFVDLPYEPAMLEEFGQQATRNVGRAETWKRDISRGVLLNRSGIWRQRMTAGQAWLVGRATGRLGRDYGYRAQLDASAPSIVRAMLGEARVRFREARDSDGVVGAARHAGSMLKALGAV
jgi:hypothetical protein